MLLVIDEAFIDLSPGEFGETTGYDRVHRFAVSGRSKGTG
jgi:hypothetical protein